MALSQGGFISYSIKEKLPLEENVEVLWGKGMDSLFVLFGQNGVLG